MNKKYAFLALVVSSSAIAAEYPKELLGNYGDPQWGEQACQSPMMIEKASRYDGMVDSECKPVKVTRMPATGAARTVTVVEHCGREDATWTLTTTFRLGNPLVMTEVRKGATPTVTRLNPCPAAPAAPSAPEAAATGEALPRFCRDEEQVGGPKKIYLDVGLQVVSEDFDSSGSIFMPARAVQVDDRLVYQGGIANFSNGQDVPGTYYIDAQEWGMLCQ